ncbi:hypothetical protein PS2_008862 [Malus domestica]
MRLEGDGFGDVVSHKTGRNRRKSHQWKKGSTAAKGSGNVIRRRCLSTDSRQTEQPTLLSRGVVLKPGSSSCYDARRRQQPPIALLLLKKKKMKKRGSLDGLFDRPDIFLSLQDTPPKRSKPQNGNGKVAAFRDCSN